MAAKRGRKKKASKSSKKTSRSTKKVRRKKRAARGKKKTSLRKKRAATTKARRTAPPQSPFGYYRQPTVHGDRIVFVSESDLWSVGTAGGIARRITSGGCVVGSPHFSPDGSMVAFSANYDGPTDAYVMESAGGVPRRLTHEAWRTSVVGWSKDGKWVRFSSSARRPFMGDMGIHEVPVVGGDVRSFNLGHANDLAEEPGGKGVVIGINTGDLARWKRYRGGTRGRLWIDRSGSGEFRPWLTKGGEELAGNLAGPMWIGGRIYFLSDEEGHANLYSATPSGRGIKRHTDHEDFFARTPDTDGKHIVYGAGADIHLFHVASGMTKRLDIRLQSTRQSRARKFVDSGDYLDHASLHPKGHSLALNVRGGLYTTALWDGAVERHGEVSATRYRLTRWLPDGKRLVGIQDGRGEEALEVRNADGSGRPKVIAKNLGLTLVLEPKPKGGDVVALTNHRQEVWLVDLKTSATKRIARSKYEAVRHVSWSPDGRWLAYALPASRHASSICVYDTKQKKTHTITRPDFDDSMPTFDPKGRYLYFLGARVYNPVYDAQYFDLGFPRGLRPYLVCLKRDVPSPFVAATRAPRLPGGASSEEAKAKTKGKGASKKKSEPTVDIDFKDIGDRVVAVPAPEARYYDLAAGADRVFFVSAPVRGALNAPDWAAGGPPAANGVLQAWGLNDHTLHTFPGRVTSIEASSSGKHLVMVVGNRIRVVDASLDASDGARKESVGPKSGWTSLARIRVEVDPGAEWRQMYREAWRLQRDFFWTESMAGVDWNAVYERYLPLVDRVATRAELSDVMWEMQGELGTSHSYELGGDYDPSRDYYQGFLGADVGWDREMRAWVIRRIVPGDSWSANASPLAAPGLGIKDGDTILAVGGRALDARTTPQSLLVNRARQAVSLTVQRGKTKPRNVVVTTLGSEYGLRYRDWVESNRAWVHKKSGGRLGYVHVPDMGPRGYSEFHRYFKHEAERDGLVVDVRYNGGGHVSQLLLEKLLRRRVGYDQSRWMGTFTYPEAAPNQGCMVALTNECAGSDGDIFSHCFKLYGLGPLIGRRTWGGVVGIWPRHSLVDGAITTQPEFANWFVDVGYAVENYGTDPDVPVDITPSDAKKGRDSQLAVAVREAMALVKKVNPRVPDMGPVPSMKAPRLPKR